MYAKHKRNSGWWIALGLCVIGVSALLGGLALPLAAAPNFRDCSGGNAAILSPQTGATVFGIVQIEGTASLGGDFQYYKLEVAPMGTEAWGDLAGQARQQVVNAQLGVWDSAAVPDGLYALRLRVVDPTGNYCEAKVTDVRVANSAPTPVPTANPEQATITPTEAPPIQNAVPTPVPTQTPNGTGTPTPVPTRAGPTRTPVPASGGIGGIEIGTVMQAIQDLFGALLRLFAFGVLTMAGILALVGVIYFVRRVL
jgi:hypothetical protein